jgi:hypothetical protein
VFASLSVPDYSKAPLSLGGVLIARGSADALLQASTPAAASRSPVEPWPASITSVRSFMGSDAITAVVPVSQAGRRQPVTAQLRARIVDEEDREVFGGAVSIDAATFGRGRQTLFQFQLPLEDLEPGRYLLSFEAAAGADTSQAAVPFQVVRSP